MDGLPTALRADEDEQPYFRARIFPLAATDAADTAGSSNPLVPLKLALRARFDAFLAAPLPNGAEGYIFNRSRPTFTTLAGNERIPPHVRVECQTGSSTEDAHLLLHFLRLQQRPNSTTATTPSLLVNTAVQIHTEDGELLLIEAADVLPDWIDPDNADGRVWMVDEQVRVIPGEIERGQSERGGDVASPGPIRDHKLALRLVPDITPSTSITQAAFEPLSSYPQTSWIETVQHRTTAYLPTEAVARVFARDPQLVARASRAFLGREGSEIRVGSRMAKFLGGGGGNNAMPSASADKSANQAAPSAPPATASTSSPLSPPPLVLLSLPRRIYAQLLSQRFMPPKSFPEGYRNRVAAFWSAMDRGGEGHDYHDDPAARREALTDGRRWDLGCKLSVGLEIAYWSDRERLRGMRVRGGGASAGIFTPSSTAEASSRDGLAEFRTSPAYPSFLQRLTKLGYFQGELQGSAQWKVLEARAVQEWQRSATFASSDNGEDADDADADADEEVELQWTQAVDSDDADAGRGGTASNPPPLHRVDPHDAAAIAAIELDDSWLWDGDDGGGDGGTDPAGDVDAEREATRRLDEFSRRIERFVGGRGDVEGAVIDDDEDGEDGDGSGGDESESESAEDEDMMEEDGPASSSTTSPRLEAKRRLETMTAEERQERLKALVPGLAGREGCGDGGVGGAEGGAWGRGGGEELDENMLRRALDDDGDGDGDGEVGGAGYAHRDGEVTGGSDDLKNTHGDGLSTRAEDTTPTTDAAAAVAAATTRNPAATGNPPPHAPVNTTTPDTNLPPSSSSSRPLSPTSMRRQMDSYRRRSPKSQRTSRRSRATMSTSLFSSQQFDGAESWQLDSEAEDSEEEEAARRKEPKEVRRQRARMLDLSESESSDDDDGGEDDGGEESAEAVRRRDEAAEMDEFLQFARRELGLSERQLEGVLQERRGRGAWVPGEKEGSEKMEGGETEGKGTGKVAGSDAAAFGKGFQKGFLGRKIGAARVAASVGAEGNSAQTDRPVQMVSENGKATSNSADSGSIAAVTANAKAAHLDTKPINDNTSTTEAKSREKHLDTKPTNTSNPTATSKSKANILDTSAKSTSTPANATTTNTTTANTTTTPANTTIANTTTANTTTANTATTPTTTPLSSFDALMSALDDQLDKHRALKGLAPINRQEYYGKGEVRSEDWSLRRPGGASLGSVMRDASKSASASAQTREMNGKGENLQGTSRQGEGSRDANGQQEGLRGSLGEEVDSREYKRQEESPSSKDAPRSKATGAATTSHGTDAMDVDDQPSSHHAPDVDADSDSDSDTAPLQAKNPALLERLLATQNSSAFRQHVHSEMDRRYGKGAGAFAESMGPDGKIGDGGGGSGGDEDMEPVSEAKIEELSDGDGDGDGVGVGRGDVAAARNPAAPHGKTSPPNARSSRDRPTYGPQSTAPPAMRYDSDSDADEADYGSDIEISGPGAGDPDDAEDIRGGGEEGQRVERQQRAKSKARAQTRMQTQTQKPPTATGMSLPEMLAEQMDADDENADDDDAPTLVNSSELAAMDAEEKAQAISNLMESWRAQGADPGPVGLMFGGVRRR